MLKSYHKEQKIQIVKPSSATQQPLYLPRHLTTVFTGSVRIRAEVWVPQNDTHPLNIEYTAAMLCVPGSFLTKNWKFHREGTLKLKIFVIYGLHVPKQRGKKNSALPGCRVTTEGAAVYKNPIVLQSCSNTKSSSLRIHRAAYGLLDCNNPTTADSSIAFICVHLVGGFSGFALPLPRRVSSWRGVSRACATRRAWFWRSFTPVRFRDRRFRGVPLSDMRALKFASGFSKESSRKLTKQKELRNQSGSQNDMHALIGPVASNRGLAPASSELGGAGPLRLSRARFRISCRSGLVYTFRCRVT